MLINNFLLKMEFNNELPKTVKELQNLLKTVDQVYMPGYCQELDDLYEDYKLKILAKIGVLQVN